MHTIYRIPAGPGQAIVYRADTAQPIGRVCRRNGRWHANYPGTGEITPDGHSNADTAAAALASHHQAVLDRGAWAPTVDAILGR